MSTVRVGHTVGDKTTVGGSRRRTRIIEKGQYGWYVKPVGRFLQTRGRAITAPVPLADLPHHAGSNRIQHHIEGQFQKVSFFFHQQTLEAALQEMSDPLMPPIKPLPIGAVELFQPTAQVGLRCFNH